VDTFHIGSCEFSDSVSGESVFMIVRLADNTIGLGLSLEEDGDVEVFLDIAKCQQLIEWLSTALATVKNISP
jgi:hypothetical protein